MKKYYMRKSSMNIINWLNCIWETNLPSNSKYLACYLRKFMNSNSDIAYPSYSRIIQETGLGRATVAKYLSVLESEGWIQRDNGSKGTNTVYIACLPKNIELAVKELDNKLQKELKGSSGGELGSSGGELGSSGGELELVREANTNKQLNKQLNNNDCWDYSKCKDIWNEATKNSECPSTDCNIVPDSLKSGLSKVHKKYKEYCKDSDKTELERHEWFKAYARGHLRRCCSFVGKSEGYSWKPSIKDLGQIKTFEALINQ